MTKISFNNKQSPFFRSLKAKVDSYLSENNLHTSGNRKLHIKGILQATTVIALYVLLVFFNPGAYISIALCAVMGFAMALIGFNVMHEGAHNSFSKKSWVNNISAYSLNFLGGSSHIWKLKHNVMHHTYTNIEGMDDDIDLRPYMRLNDQQPKKWYHRFQHFYFLFFYSLAYFAWVFILDFQKYFSGKIVKTEATRRKFETKEHVIFWVTKVGFVIVYFLIPVFMLGLVNVLIGFAVLMATCGIVISIVFQLAHIVEGTHFPQPDSESNKIEQEWAVHQINTTANFATNSKLVSWLVGGLNFQVEHHLFPRISHVHYPAINKLVKQTCQEFNVAYLEFPTLASAVKAHLVHIKKLGQA